METSSIQVVGSDEDEITTETGTLSSVHRVQVLKV